MLAMRGQKTGIGSVHDALGQVVLPWLQFTTSVLAWRRRLLFHAAFYPSIVRTT
jgi:hypothetical protein